MHSVGGHRVIIINMQNRENGHIIQINETHTGNNTVGLNKLSPIASILTRVS